MYFICFHTSNLTKTADGGLVERRTFQFLLAGDENGAEEVNTDQSRCAHITFNTYDWTKIGYTVEGYPVS